MSLRRLVLFAVIVVAIGFVHRRRRRKQAVDLPAPLAHPTMGTSTVGVVGETTTAVHFQPKAAPSSRRDEPEKS